MKSTLLKLIVISSLTACGTDNHIYLPAAAFQSTEILEVIEEAPAASTPSPSPSPLPTLGEAEEKEPLRCCVPHKSKPKGKKVWRCFNVY